MRNFAHIMVEHGFSVVPILRREKRPKIRWKQLCDAPMSHCDVDRCFCDDDSIAIICGAVSGGIACLDFDEGAVLWDAFARKMDCGYTDWRSWGYMERSRSGGLHYVVRVSGDVGGSRKLAYSGTLRTTLGRPKTVLESKGNRGYFITCPSDGYARLSGSLLDLPTISPAQWEDLCAVGESLNAAQNFRRRPNSSADFFSAPSEISGAVTATRNRRESRSDDDSSDWSVSPISGMSIEIDLDRLWVGAPRGV